MSKPRARNLGRAAFGLAIVALTSPLAARADAPRLPRAEEPPPHVIRPPYEPPPSEADRARALAGGVGTGVVALQLVSGVTIPFVALGISGFDGSPVWPVLFSSPLVLGGAICGAGALSRTYESSCLITIAATAAGALMTAPLMYLGGAGGSSGLIVIFGGLGWLVLQPAAGFVAWHAVKRPRAWLLAPPPRPSTRAAAMPGQVTTTLATFSF